MQLVAYLAHSSPSWLPSVTRGTWQTHGLGRDGNSYNHAKMEKRLLLQSRVWPNSGKHPTHTSVLLWSGCTCCSTQRLVLQVCWEVLSEQVSLLMLFMTCCMGLSPVLLGKVGVVVRIAVTAGRSREVVC